MMELVGSVWHPEVRDLTWCGMELGARGMAQVDMNAHAVNAAVLGARSFRRQLIRLLYRGCHELACRTVTSCTSGMAPQSKSPRDGGFLQRALGQTLREGCTSDASGPCCAVTDDGRLGQRIMR